MTRRGSGAIHTTTALDRYAWQGGTNLPDTKLGWVILNADGGHVGTIRTTAAIRRWRAPRDGVVSIAW